MRKAVLSLLIGAGFSAALAAPATAQSGFALKGHYIVNATSAQTAREDRQIPDANAFGLGAEFVLPFGLGVGVSGYTANDSNGLDAETTELTVLGEANYFVKFPLLPVSPYVGVHAGLGRLSGDNITDPGLEIQDKTRQQIGYQLGVRFQPTRMFGIDAQWRHMSTSATSDQADSLERNQVLLGITLF